MRYTLRKVLKAWPIKFTFELFKGISKQNLILDQKIDIKFENFIGDFELADLTVSHIINFKFLQGFILVLFPGN